MMKFLGKFSDQFARERRHGSSIFRVVQYSTEINPSDQSSLYQRFKQCNLERVSLIPVLDEWAAQGGKLDRERLKHCMKTYRNNGRFSPALEVFSHTICVGMCAWVGFCIIFLLRST